jgi:hypothetical protein
MVVQQGLWIVSNGTVTDDFVAFIPYAIESDWDDIWAPRLAGFPVNLRYAEWIQNVGMVQSEYLFDPASFVQGEYSRQMQYRPTVRSDYSVLVVLHQNGRIDTFKHRGPELICEASGPDFLSAMVHTTARGIAPGEQWTIVNERENQPS